MAPAVPSSMQSARPPPPARGCPHPAAPAHASPLTRCLLAHFYFNRQTARASNINK